MTTVLEGDSDGGALTDAARTALWGGWDGMSRRRTTMEQRRAYASGRGGVPDVDSDASEELRDLAKISRLGMCRVVVRTFVRGLAVVGFRSPAARADDQGWAWWQAHRLDARQALVHRQALTYGESFVSVLPDDDRADPARAAFWTPLSCRVEYDEPDDRFPQRAVLVRRSAEGHVVLLVDDTTVTPGLVRPAPTGADDGLVGGSRYEDVEITGQPWEHGATYDGRPVCPVVRFVDGASDDERRGEGVVEPVIELNRAMNQVNFDRLCVARFGAHDQKLLIGWSASKDRLVKLSTSHIAAIDVHPDEVRVDRWQASPLAPYNELIRELREQVALEAAIPLWATGSISNVSVDTAAMIEAAHQRELSIKRDTLGEAWEQVLRLAVTMSAGDAPAEDAEVVWRETQARSLGVVVDAIAKLVSVGVPVTELLDLVPGMTKQRIDAVRDGLQTHPGASTP